ncbi:hypothetical protein GCM10027051_10600 [Niabella terrae]
MMHKELIQKIAASRKRPNILVVGDMMADRYVWGTASRISPEAPVPVLMAREETLSLGGSANVARNLSRLNAKVAIAGITGADLMGEQLTELLRKEQIDTTAVLEDHERPTTIKTRVMSGNHQLLRVDRESTAELSANASARLLKKLEPRIRKADIVMLSDYNKGLLTADFTQKLIKICHRLDKKVLIDPKGLNYRKYKGAWLIKPNRRELAEATVTEKIQSRKQVTLAARKLLDQTKSTHLIVTLSEEGLALVSAKKVQYFPVKAREVFDVTGAGDTVFACLGFFLACGVEIATACELANYAAAIAVSKVGGVAVTLEEILSLIETHTS